MSSGKSEPVIIRILDREYTVGCEPDERDSLAAAARLLDARMREIRGGNRVAAMRDEWDNALDGVFAVPDAHDRTVFGAAGDDQAFWY